MKLRNDIKSNSLLVPNTADRYLDWQPAICVFEIQRSLVSAEGQSVVRLKALQLLLAVHDEYLKREEGHGCNIQRGLKKEMNHIRGFHLDIMTLKM